SRQRSDWPRPIAVWARAVLNELLPELFEFDATVLRQRPRARCQRGRSESSRAMARALEVVDGSEELVRASLPRVEAKYVLAPALAHRSGTLRIAEELCKRFGEKRLIGGDQNSGLSRDDRVTRSALVDDHHRHAESPGLDHRESEGLEASDVREQVGGGIVQ